MTPSPLPLSPTEGWTELLGKLKAAPGPDRELDAEICSALDGGSIVWLQTRYTGETYPALRRASPSHVGGFVNDHCPFVTSSVDAALALAERVHGKMWSVGYDGAGYTAEMIDYPPFVGRARTPALALCIAILEARSALAKASPASSEADPR